jgi:hypothetical protein
MGRATIAIPITSDRTTEGDETLTVTVQGQSASTNIVDSSKSVIQFAATSGTSNEGNTALSVVTVQTTLSAASTQTVTIPISYSGTATQGTDYTNAIAIISIPAGQTTGTATFSATGDATVEPNETTTPPYGYTHQRHARYQQGLHPHGS